jgi:hypothetical protein
LGFEESSLNGRFDSGVSADAAVFGDWHVSSSAIIGDEGVLPLPRLMAEPKKLATGVLLGSTPEEPSVSTSRGMMNAFLFGLSGVTGSVATD